MSYGWMNVQMAGYGGFSHAYSYGAAAGVNGVSGVYGYGAAAGVSGASGVYASAAGVSGQAAQGVNGYGQSVSGQNNNGTETGAVGNNSGDSEKVKPGYRSSPAECKTCRERKYKDGSDEMVSYKTAAHISPSEAPMRVMAHEGEHVANAYKKAEQNNGKVLSVSVSIHTAVCPECGRVYVSGRETRTSIMYRKDDEDEAANDGREVLGANIDLIA